MKLQFPKTEIRPFVEELHGRRMVDEYRWLETSGMERTNWIDQQNKLVDDVILSDPKREDFQKRFNLLYNIDQSGFPVATLSRIFYRKIKSGQKKSSLYTQALPDGEERILIDMNNPDEVSNISLGHCVPTRDGSLLAYRISENGSDWTHLYIMNVNTGEVSDEIPRLVYTWTCWLPDNSGFVYARSADPDKLTKNGLCVFLHKLGEDWRHDRMILGEGLTETDMANPVAVSRDGRHLIMEVKHGLSDSELFYTNLHSENTLVKSITAGHKGRYEGLISDNVLYVKTSNEAPNYRICKIQLNENLPHISKWDTIVPEADTAILSFNVLGEKLFITMMIDVLTNTFIHSLEGKATGKIDYPGIGVGTIPRGEDEADAVFVCYFSSYEPPKTYRYSIRDNELSLFFESSLKVNTDEYLTEQVFYRSFDGTVVPMSVTMKKDTPFDGSNPTILSGYGGFGGSELSFFSPSNLFWLEQGGIYAKANIRGGGEYGESWHKDGMLQNKQNVFDDFIAAGEALTGIRPVRPADGEHFELRRYTNSMNLGIMGGSNGGLLTGAALVQRPDLWSAVVSKVPLLDMLRYHLTQGGKYWISEYGDPDNPKDFEWLLSYSPYHNVKHGDHFPPTLLQTSLHDDRGTDSLHAFKMAAKLQAANSSDSPILLRTMTEVGHGTGRTTQMNIDEQTEIFLFLAKYLM